MSAELRDLRHSSSIGNRSTSSPRKHPPHPSAAADDDGFPLLSSAADGGDVRHFREVRPFWWSLLFSEDSRTSSSSPTKLSLVLIIALVVAGFVSVSSLISRLNAPYLCKKDGITLHCPRVKETPSLWENPYSATTSWKPCAERHKNGMSDIPRENETNGYIFIHAEGGLNQQRIAICNAVAVAKIMNATLILPVLKQDQIWKDQTWGIL